MQSTSITFFIILLIVICIGWSTPHKQPLENFQSCSGTPMEAQFIADPVSRLYQNWGNGGINEEPEFYESRELDGGLLRTYAIPPYYPPASTRLPTNTLVDQLTCHDYAKRSCLGVKGHDRFDYCRSGQYDQCMNGRKHLLWGVSDADSGSLA